MHDFFIKVKQQFEQKLPFVIYSKPDLETVSGLFQKNDVLYFSKNFKEKGFVFAPFDNKEIIFIPENNSDLIDIKFASKPVSRNTNFEISINKVAKNDFENLVQKGIDAINIKSFSKVVLSREEIVDLPTLDIVSLFKKLVNSYPKVFTYCFYHPKIGLWMGATPEQLLKANGTEFKTVSLAGTQLFKDNQDIIWGNKEIEEQQFVTNYITKTISDVTSKVQISLPYTLKAGNLLHLKTDISGIINHDVTLKQLVLILHPTPAVCGLPKNESKKFIIENENYNRSFYAGFLGEINNNENSETDLFVNLRCMQLVSSHEKVQAHLYVGCGITSNSNPENEWQESVNKAMTMKNILL